MTPLEIIALGLELLRGFSKSGKLPDQPATPEEMEAASKAAHVGLDDLQKLIDAAKGKP